jgi:hypothetical protein
MPCATRRAAAIAAHPEFAELLARAHAADAATLAGQGGYSEQPLDPR